MPAAHPSPHVHRSLRSSALPLAAVFLASTLALACGGDVDPDDAEAASDADAPTWDQVQDTSSRVATITGLQGPEAVRYDPDQDVYFVSNFGDDDAEGTGNGNGFISRVSPDGTMEELRFMTGVADAPLEQPRGMFIVGDTLWVADADGVHGFDRTSGEHVRFVDLSSHDPGFLNDVAAGPDGVLYITDSSQSTLYRVAGGEGTLAVDDTLLGPPNGITWDAEGERFVLAPWGGGTTIRAWRADTGDFEEVGTSPSGGRFDGIEIYEGRILAASQSDGAIHVLEGPDGAAQGRVLIRVPGRPADIAVDTQRGRVAVPYIALDRVDIWRLPAG